MKDSDHSDVTEAMHYLEDGGVTETAHLAYAAYEMSHPQVQLSTAMAIALCMLAHEAIQARIDAKETRQ